MTGRILVFAGALCLVSATTKAVSGTVVLAQTAESQDRMRRAIELEAQSVNELYSTKPKHVFLGGREYRIPANFFGPKQKNETSTLDADQIGYFGFLMFLPDYGGYTTENWRDKFDRRLIQVVQIKTVDKNKMMRLTDGQAVKIRPENYGEPRARFENARSRLENTPSLHAYGLEGYRPMHMKVDVTWAGIRSNGEFFFFRCPLAPGDPPRAGMPEPHCDVRYYSEKEGLFIAYRYSNDHVEKWREIDDAIWAKLHEWRIK